MATEHGNVYCSVMFLLMMVLTPLCVRGSHAPSGLLGNDPDLLNSFPLHRIQTPNIQMPNIDESNEQAQLRRLNKVKLRSVREGQLNVAHQEASSSSVISGSYYTVPSHHTGSLDRKKVVQHKSMLSQAYVLTDKEFERQRLGFDRRLTALRQDPVRNAGVIKKLEASWDILSRAHDNHEDTRSNHRLLYAFFVACCITLLLSCSS